MKIKNLSIVLLIFLGILFAGCTFSTNNPKPKISSTTKICKSTAKTNIIDKKISNKEKELSFLNSEPVKDFIVTGEGIAPRNTISPAQAIALAKRAAVADAYRQLGAKLYGVKINAKDTVEDAALKDSKIITQVNGLIKDAYIVDTSFKNGLYRVKMELKIDSKTWKRIFSY